MIIKRDGNNTRKQARICHCIELLKITELKTFSFEVIKTVDYIDTYQELMNINKREKKRVIILN